MWFIIGSMTLTSPIALSLFERCIREPETPVVDNSDNISMDAVTIDDMEMEEDSGGSPNAIELAQMGSNKKMVGNDVKFIELPQDENCTLVDNDSTTTSSYNPMQIL